MFPAEFGWGTTTSSTQSEGAPERSDWAGWEASGRAPRSGRGNGFAGRFAEDLELAASTGLVDHQISLPWARLEPVAGRFDEAEVERYLVVLGAARNAGLRPWVCLLHHTIPGWFEDLGGFGDDRAAGYAWPRWVDEVAQRFGDLAHGWVPIHAPGAMAMSGWLTGASPPGRRDFAEYSQVVARLTIAHRDAHRQLRGAGQPISTIATVPPVFAADGSPGAGTARGLLDEALTGSVVRGFRDGLLVRPGRDPQPLADLAGSADVIGVECGPAVAVDAEMAISAYPVAARRDGRGRALWPEAISRVLERLAEELPGVPLVVSGVGVATSDEVERVIVLHEMLQRIESAVEDGIAVVGVRFEPIIDCYDWTAGWSAPGGLFDRERSPRAAAELVADTIATATVPSDLEPYLDSARER